MTKIFSARELCIECEREIKQRLRVYNRLIEQKKMKRDDADRQIAMMQQIRDRYDNEATAEETRSRLL